MYFTASNTILQKEFKKDQSRHLKDITYICVFLLFSGSIYPVCANPVTSDLPTDESVPLLTLKVSEMPFKKKLSNPCSVDDTSKLHRDAIRNHSTNSSRARLMSFLRAKVLLLKANAEAILQTHLLTDCPTLKLPAVAIIPTAEDVSDSTPVDGLRQFYTSLLNHTAHVYFISEQSERYSDDRSCNFASLPTNANALASDMKILMCILRLSILAHQEDTDDNFFQGSTDEIFNEDLTDLPVCSKRVMKDCQTVDSTVSLLTAFSKYLKTLGFDENAPVTEAPVTVGDS